MSGNSKRSRCSLGTTKSTVEGLNQFKTDTAGPPHENDLFGQNVTFVFKGDQIIESTSGKNNKIDSRPQKQQRMSIDSSASSDHENLSNSRPVRQAALKSRKSAAFVTSSTSRRRQSARLSMLGVRRETLSTSEFCGSMESLLTTRERSCNTATVCEDNPSQKVSNKNLKNVINHDRRLSLPAKCLTLSNNLENSFSSSQSLGTDQSQMESFETLCATSSALPDSSQNANEDSQALRDITVAMEQNPESTRSSQRVRVQTADKSTQQSCKEPFTQPLLVNNHSNTSLQTSSFPLGSCYVITSSNDPASMATHAQAIPVRVIPQASQFIVIHEPVPVSTVQSSCQALSVVTLPMPSLSLQSHAAIVPAGSITSSGAGSINPNLIILETSNRTDVPSSRESVNDCVQTISSSVNAASSHGTQDNAQNLRSPNDPTLRESRTEFREWLTAQLANVNVHDSANVATSSSSEVASSHPSSSSSNGDSTVTLFNFSGDSTVSFENSKNLLCSLQNSTSSSSVTSGQASDEIDSTLVMYDEDGPDLVDSLPFIRRKKLLSLKSRLTLVPRTQPTPLPRLSWANNEDVWSRMKLKEFLYPRNPDNLKNHPNVKPRMRAILLEWLSEVCEVYTMHRETYYLAAEYIDRYLSRASNVPKQQLQLVGITCLLMAAKMEEIYPPKITEFAYVTDGACSIEHILAQELVIVKMLDWRLSPMTTIAWLTTYLQILQEITRTSSKNRSEYCEEFVYQKFNGETFVQICRLLDLCLLDGAVLSFNAALVAASAISYFFGSQVATVVSTYSKQELVAVQEWMEPFALVIKKMKEPAPMKCFKNVPIEDMHNIQLKSATIDMLDMVTQLIEEDSQPQAVVKRQNDESPCTGLQQAPPSMLTPPKTDEKRDGEDGSSQDTSVAREGQQPSKLVYSEGSAKIS